MKKMNNKGVTLIELIVSFAIVAVAIIYFFQTLYTVKKVYTSARNETQMFIDKDYALRIIDAKFQALENSTTATTSISVNDIFTDHIKNTLNVCDAGNGCSNPSVCKLNNNIIVITFDFYRIKGDKRINYQEVLYEHTTKYSGISNCGSGVRMSPRVETIKLSNVSATNNNTTTTTANNSTTKKQASSNETVSSSKATTTKKNSTKKTVKTDISCPVFTYSKDNKTFTTNPASVYNSDKVYVKISMNNSKYSYNKWYWYADNGKGGFTKYSTAYEKNNHVVNISGEGTRIIRAQVFNTNTNKSKNCDSKTINIDRTAPKCPTITASGTKADSTWYKTDVTLNIKPTSDTSKWEWYTNQKDGGWYLWTNNNVGTQKKSLGDDGARTRQGKIVVYDKAGNKRTCYTDKYKIDKTLAYVTGKLVHPTKNTGSWSEGTRTSSDHLHYSASYGGNWHGGNDITVNKGTSVVAMDGGEVIKADTTTNKCSSSKNCKSEGYVHFGKFVLLKHYIDGKNYYTVYGHLNKVSVSVGDKVKQGQKIGESGNTGNSSGPHLHVGMSYNKYDNNGYPIYSKNVIAPYVYISGNKKGKTYVGDTGKNK